MRFVLTNATDPGRADDYSAWYDAYENAIILPACSQTRSASRTRTPLGLGRGFYLGDLLVRHRVEVVFQPAEAQAEAILRRARDRVPDHPPVTTVLSTEPVEPALIRQIKDRHHDLVVMGSRGRAAIGSALLGSVSPLRPAPQPRPRPHRPYPGAIERAEGGMSILPPPPTITTLRA